VYSIWRLSSVVHSRIEVFATYLLLSFASEKADATTHTTAANGKE